ncbi:trigger factor [Patescibacteria group bacterium]|nr:trigger factor [Patescibacteria group bacterium]
MKTFFKKLPKSQIEIEFEISAQDFKKHIDHALLHLREHIKMNGFRPGQVPQKIVEEKVGKENLLMEAGDLAVKESYSAFVKENRLEPISEPEVKILKIAEGSPLLFKIKTTILPEVDLPDYKKIAGSIKKKEISVSQEEIEDSLDYIRKSRAKFSQIDRPAEKKDFVEIEYSSPSLNKDGKAVKDQFILSEGKMIPGFEDNIVGMSKGEEKEFSVKFPENSQRKDLAGKNINFKVKMVAVQKVEIPEINNEFIKSLGEFDDVDSLKVNIKEGIKIEKEMQEKQRQRIEMLERMAKDIKIELPEILVNLEKEQLFKDFQIKITKDFKITIKDYLASIKQDEETLKNSFLKEAEKKVKNFLILKNIGSKENILVEAQKIEEKTNETLKNYSIDTIKQIDINELKEYIKGVIYNEKVFQKLESFI